MFGTEEELKVHKETEHKEPIIYNCGKCDMKFFTSNRLAEHIDQEHNCVVIVPLKSESHVCCKCTSMFGTEDELKVHNETEHKEPIIDNEHMDQEHKNIPGHLNDHHAKDIHTVHDQNKSISGPPPKPSVVHVAPPIVSLSPESFLECSKCSKKFNDNGCLEKHIEEDHIIVKVYNCKACDYRTTLQQAFAIHVDTPHVS